MKRHKIGLIITQPEEQKWDTVLKFFRFPNLTLPTLAALIPEEEWEIEIQDELTGPLDFDRGYDLVLLTITTCIAPKAYAVSKMFQDRGARVVAGGIHPSVLPREVARHVDAVVVGEGETTLPRVLVDFKKGKLKRTYRSEGQVERWDVRKPRWDLLDPDGYYLRESLTATRGCNHRCSFCTISLATGPGFRKKPVEEVARLLDAIDGQFIMFWDDDLGSDPRYTRELCQLLKPQKKMWMGQMNLQVARSEETLRELADSGCVAMFIGLESINQDSLKSVDKKNQVHAYEELIRRIYDHEIGIFAGMVVGMDHDDLSTFERTVEWCDRMGIAGAIWRILTPYPGTKLFRELDAQGRILTRDWTYYDGENVVHKPGNMTVEQLYWGHKWTKRNYYSFGSIGRRIARRVSLKEPEALLKAVGTGLGTRSMFLFQNDRIDVDPYRDRHLPPPPVPIPYRFPYPRQNGFKVALKNRAMSLLYF